MVLLGLLQCDSTSVSILKSVTDELHSSACKSDLSAMNGIFLYKLLTTENNRCSDKTEKLAMLHSSMQKCTNFRSTANKLGGKLMSIDFCCHSKVTCFFSPRKVGMQPYLCWQDCHRRYEALKMFTHRFSLLCLNNQLSRKWPLIFSSIY